MMQMMQRRAGDEHHHRHRPRPSRAAPRAEVVRVRVPQHSIASELRAIRIVWRRDLIRFVNDRIRIVATLVQPLLFLFVLGSGPPAACRAPAPTAST